MYLEMTHKLDFKTPKFPSQVIYSRYRLDEDNPCVYIVLLYLLFCMGYAMFVESASLN